MNPFRAYRINQVEKSIVAAFEDITLDQLTDGDVVIKVHYSDVNYKDALAATGKGRILRQYPLNGGIDLSGVVVSSSDPRFSEGQPVLVAGAGLSETLDGGYAEYARLPASCVVPLPQGLSLFEAMALGKAGSIQPVTSPAFTVVFRFQDFVDQTIVGIWSFVCEKLCDLFIGWW